MIKKMGKIDETFVYLTGYYYALFLSTDSSTNELLNECNYVTNESPSP